LAIELTPNRLIWAHEVTLHEATEKDRTDEHRQTVYRCGRHNRPLIAWIGWIVVKLLKHFIKGKKMVLILYRRGGGSQLFSLKVNFLKSLILKVEKPKINSKN
jgi:hypothetical protein